MDHKEKQVTLVQNQAGGIDLVTERDAGNTVRILTGRPASSRQFWTAIKDAAERALEQLDTKPVKK